MELEIGGDGIHEWMGDDLFGEFGYFWLGADEVRDRFIWQLHFVGLSFQVLGLVENEEVAGWDLRESDWKRAWKR